MYLLFSSLWVQNYLFFMIFWTPSVELQKSFLFLKMFLRVSYIWSYSSRPSSTPSRFTSPSYPLNFYLLSFFLNPLSPICVSQIRLGEEPTPEALWTFPVAPVTSSSSARAGTSCQPPPPCWFLSGLSFPVSCGCCHKCCEFKSTPPLLCLWQSLSLVGRAVI